MSRFPALSGFQSAIVVIMLTYAVITLTHSIGVEASPAFAEALQDQIAAPPSKVAMDELMKQKLTAAQGALEAISRDDFEQLHNVATQMIALSHKEIWEQMASPRFVQDTADFLAAVEFMDRMAEARDADGANLGFVRLTMSCANCHRHMRSPKVAEQKRYPHSVRQTQLAGL
jgi:hypothetical protein